MKRFALPDLSTLKVVKFVNKHSTAFTTAAELGLVTTTIFLAVKNTSKAEELIEAKKEELNVESAALIPMKDKLKIYGFSMWPAALSYALTSGLIVTSNVKHANTVKDLTMATMMAQNAADNYKEAVKRKLGETEANKISTDAALISAERSDLHVKGIIDTGHGHELFYDPILGIWFYSSNQFVKKVALDFINQMSHSNSGCYSAFAEMNGLPYNGRLQNRIFFIRDDPSYRSLPAMRLEYGTCSENLHELTGEKYAVITWSGNEPQFVDDDILWSLDD